MVVLLLFPLALADSFTLAAGDSLAELVKDAQATSGPDTISVASDYVSDGVGVDVSGEALAFEPLDGVSYELPPLYGTSATLDITGATFTGGVKYPGAYFGADAYCALCLALSELVLRDVEIATTANHGVLVLDTDVSADGLTLYGTPGRGFSHYSYTAETTVTLSGSTFYGNTAGAIKVYNGGGDLNFTLHDSLVYGNTSVEGAGIYVYGEDIEVIDTTFESNRTRAGGTIHLNSAGGTFTGATISRNWAAWGDLVFADLGGHDLVFSECSLTGGTSGFDAIVNGEGNLLVENSLWAPSGIFERIDGAMQVTGTLIGAPSTRLGAIYGYATTLSVTDNVVCGVGNALVDFDGVVVGAEGSNVEFARNVVTGIAGESALLFSGGIDNAAAGPAYFEIVDNTFVANDSASLFEGEATGLLFVNNLVKDSVAYFDLESFPSATTGDYNLWHGVSPSAGPGFPADWGAHDVTGQDPLLVDSFDPYSCGSEPGLKDGSPAIDAGDPGRTDADGESRSDIGAIDGTRGAGPGGSVDLDGDGYPADVDCDDDNPRVNPAGDDEPYDDIDQDCDGVAATISYGGGCACDGAFAGSPALFLLALARRRR